MIKVCALHEMPALKDDFEFVISICDPGFKLPRINEKHYIASFWDNENPTGDEFWHMKTEVRKLGEWIKAHQLDHQKHNILVHCHAGVSRSAAVAWIIMVMNGRDIKEAFRELFKARPQIWPNVMVIELAVTQLGLDRNMMKIAHELNAELAEERKVYLGYGG